MISIIVSSVRAHLFEQLSNNIKETIGVDHEIIKISNPNIIGICEAYNIGALQAKYEILCFCHEDILFKTQNWGYKLANHFKNHNISLIGVLGNLIKTKIPSGVYSSVQNSNRINQLQRLPDQTNTHYYINPLNEEISEVSILDGMLLCTQKKFWEKHPFDQLMLKGFHGYDIDFSLSMGKLGKVVVVYDILIEHFSSGGNTHDWLNSQLLVNKKWFNQLSIKPNNVSKKIVRLRVIDDLVNINITLLKLKHKGWLRYKFALLLFFKRPFKRISLSFFKQIIFTNHE